MNLKTEECTLCNKFHLDKKAEINNANHQSKEEEKYNKILMIL
jgi:hypothetical protein